MSKSYIQVRPDLADAAAVAAYVTAYPKDFTAGTQIHADDGSVSIVTVVGTARAIAFADELPP
jgi:hypothetical protein